MRVFRVKWVLRRRVLYFQTQSGSGVEGILMLLGGFLAYVIGIRLDPIHSPYP